MYANVLWPLTHQLANGDTHPVRAQIAQAENAAAVGDHYDLHWEEASRHERLAVAGQPGPCPYLNIVLGPVVRHRPELAQIVGTEIHAPRPSPPVSKQLADLPDRGRIDVWGELLNVVQQDVEEEVLVAVVPVRPGKRHAWSFSQAAIGGNKTRAHTNSSASYSCGGRRVRFECAGRVWLPVQPLNNAWAGRGPATLHRTNPSHPPLDCSA